MRRREPARAADERPVAPLWIRQINFGLRHFSEGDVVELGGPATRRWRQAQNDWCRDVGCWRVGKTCVEASGRSCGAAGRHESEEQP